MISLLFCLLIELTSLTIKCTSIYNNWIVGDSLLPERDDAMAVAYDSGNDLMWILGGRLNSQQRLVSFSNGLITDHGQYNLSRIVYGYAQYFSTIGNTLWMIDYQGTYLNSFNMETVRFQSNVITIPIVLAEYASLSSVKYDTFDHLIVTGGWTGSTTGVLNDVQIVNVSSSEWISDVPKMQNKRRGHSSIVHNNILYVIGGDNGVSYHSSIEILDINDLIRISSEQWNYIASLPKPLEAHSIVVYNDDIIIIGGWTNINGYNDEIYVVDTTINVVKSEGHLNFGIRRTSSIVVYPYIYIFGGRDINNVLNQWQYTIGPTTSPTSAPSKTPTLEPTTYPTIEPTTYPTIKSTTIDSTQSEYSAHLSTKQTSIVAESSETDHHDEININVIIGIVCGVIGFIIIIIIVIIKHKDMILGYIAVPHRDADCEENPGRIL